MKTKRLKLWKSFVMLFVAFFLAAASFTAKANSEYCRYLVGTGTSRVYLSVETNNLGQIIFTVYPFDQTVETSTAFTAFRNTGWNDARMQLFTVNGNANTAWKYFTRTIDVAKSQVTLTPVAGMITAGDIIAGNQSMEWRTPLNTNAYGNVNISYTYGSTCPQPTVLTDPSGLAIDATAHLTFIGDAAATSHIATVFSGSIPVYEQPNFTSGDVLNFLSAGTYTIKVRSIGDNNLHLSSGYSVAIPWFVAGTTPPLGNSEQCHKYWDPSGVGGIVGDGDAVFVTWETLGNGSIKVTFEGVNGNQPTFRGGSFNPANLLIGPIALATNFVDITQTANVATITPKAGVVIPDGTVLMYNGQVAYQTAGGIAPNGNLYPTGTFTYTYKTNCANVVQTKLAAPTNVAVDGTGILTFNSVENAATYNAFVYLGSTVVYSQYTIANGAKLNFSLPGTFSVRVVAVPAVTATEYIQSDSSTPYSWTVNYLVPTTIPTSVYCHWLLDPTGGGNAVATDEDALYWTWTTDALGQIVIGIEGKITPATTAFRAGGMDLGGFNIEGVPAALLLDKVGNSSGLTQTFKAKEGIVLLPGLKVTFSGKVEYRVLPLNTDLTNLDDLYPTLTFPNPYIYGSNCNGDASVLPAPTNLVLSADNKLSFDAVANAVSYKVYVYDPTGVLVYTQELFTSGSVINYAIPGHNTVKVQAIGNAADLLSSGLSESVNWNLIATLAKPLKLGIDTENKLTFTAVTSSVSYTVTVYQNAADVTPLVTLPNFVIGSVVEMGTNPYGIYYVKVKAVGDGDVILDSPVSDTYSWNFQAPFVCNLLLTHPLIKGSSAITFTKPDNTIVSTAPYFAPNFAASTNYTFEMTNNVANIHLGVATNGNWQAQFRFVPTTPIMLKPGTSYKLKAKVKTSKSTSMLAKVFDTDDNTFIELIPRQNVNSTVGIVFEIPSIVPPAGMTRIFQMLFDFAPSPADINIEISDIVICGEEGTTGFDDVKSKGISIYPVPAKDFIYIDGINGLKTVRIIDIVGKVVLAEQSTGSINISTLNKGIYMLSVDNLMVKFIKE